MRKKGYGSKGKSSLPKGRKGNSGNTKRTGKGKAYKPKNARRSK